MTTPERVRAYKFWQHFKGNRYKVLEVANHSETDEILVIYQSIDTDPPKVWARPIRQWEEYVETEKGIVRRFTPFP